MGRKITAELILATIETNERKGVLDVGERPCSYSPVQGKKYWQILRTEKYANRSGKPRSEYVGKDGSAAAIALIEAGRRKHENKLLRQALRLYITDPAEAKAFIKKSGIQLYNALGDAGASVEWYTPPEYVELARTVLGEIDLDPASNCTAQEWIRAGRYYTKDDDGLTQPWFGRVWCNPPYGDFAPLFTQRAFELYGLGKIEACILLLNRVDGNWFLDAKETAVAVCECRQRISFVDSQGKKVSGNRYASDFLYLGSDRDRFANVFKQVGRLSLSLAA